MDLESFLRRVGHNVRTARWLAGRTQEQLAEVAGLAPRYLQELEAGRVNASLEMLLRLAGALGVTVGALVEVPPGRRKLRTTLVGVEATPPRRGPKPTRRRT